MTPQLDLIPFLFSHVVCNLCVQERLAIAPHLGSTTRLYAACGGYAVHICEIILLILITCVYRALIKLLFYVT